MGESKRLNRKAIFAVLIISMFIFSIPQISTLNPLGSSQGNQSGESKDLQPNLPEVDNAPGPSRPISEYALGTRTGQTVTLPSSPNAYVDLGSGWVGNSATVDVVNLWDNRDHAVNGSFYSGSGTSSPPWSFSKYDPLAHSTFSGTWVQNSPQSNNRTVQCTMPLPSGSITFSGNERVSWNETILPARGTVLSARLVFNWWPVVATGFTRSEFVFYATVNNTRLVGVGSPFPWQVNLKDVASNPSMNGHWNLANFTLPISAFDLPSKRISIQIGIMYTSGSATYTGWNTQNIMYIDNVKLILQAYAKPHNINLKVKPQGFSDAVVSDGSGYGTGAGKMSGFTTSGTSFPFIFSGGNLTLPDTAGLTCTVKVNATRQTSASSTFQMYGAGLNVSWQFSYRTYFSGDGQPIGSGPTYYSKYYFNISIPSDYNLANPNCTDPDGVFHGINLQANNFTKYPPGSSWVIRVNVTRIGSYTGPSNPPPNGPFAPYQISAFSGNYVKMVKTQLKNGTLYADATRFYPQNWTRFVAYIAGTGGPVTTGAANLTISGPPTYGASPVVLTTVPGGAPNATGHANFLVLWNSTNAAGSYTGEVDWVDSSLGEAGSLTCSFEIFHKFNLTITFPAINDVILSPSTIATPPTTAKVRDYYTGESIAATVKGKASWENKTTSWAPFTAGADVGAYTNVTKVPSGLVVDSQVWIAANSSKTYYDLGIANNTMYIGAETVVNPSVHSFHVRYTESQAYNVSYGSFHYYIPPSTDVTDAELTLLAEASTDDTIVNWNARTVLDLSQSGSGLYGATIYMFTQSAKGIPSGAYDVWFKLKKGTHYQTQTFKFVIQVDSQPTVLGKWTGDGQSVFWGDTALVQINFTTQFAGSWDWSPFVSLPVRNLSYYIPPYVSVTVDQGANKWTYNWTVKPNQLYLGTYDLYFDTRQFTNPTPSGTQVKIDVGFHKSNYDNPTGVQITLYIKSLTTRMTGAVRDGGVYILTNTTSVYPGDSKSIFVWYNDTHTGVSIGVGAATVTYTSSGGNILGAGTLAPVTGAPGLYNLTLSGTTTNQIPGTYQIFLNGQKGSYYVARDVTVTLSILPIPSTLNVYDPIPEAFYLDRVVFLVWFNDTHNAVPISGATMSVTAPGMTIVSPSEVPGVPGLYNLTIPSGQAVGSYGITIRTNKTRYSDGSTAINLDINSLPTATSTYSIVSGGPIKVGTNVTVSLGESFQIYLWFNDTHNGVPVAGIENFITYTSAEFGHSWVTPVAGTPGLYMVSFDASDAGIFEVSFAAAVAGYTSQTVVFTVTVQAPPPGFNIVTVMFVGLGGGGIVIVGVVGWLLLKRARVPFIIKKIDESLKLIGKGDHEAATPVALRSREEIVVGITQERIDVFGRRPAGPEAAEAVAEAAAVAPTPEKSELKKELEAVEPKEKSGDVIEEVEMDTLDEELQKLEKFEDKDNLPDGAKEVRDVVEKYKQSKKKKD